MESMVITAGSRTDLDVLRILATKLGFSTFELSARDKRLLARRKMAELARVFPKIKVSEQEIILMVEQIRAERHAQTNSH